MAHEEPTPAQLRATYDAVQNWLDSLETVLDVFESLGLLPQVEVVANLHGSLERSIEDAMAGASE
ncbi:hypothetical protein SEA_LOZINAK_63 [Gordonia phage Lozinak]|uniref:Uncharacterized protein n=5 Tax=Smoothievirus TaxID=1982557 RepID=A0A2D1GFQ9_9CAUD|nr:hypothetical protein BEN60_gp143 [Gordonia phage Smoothie]YP_009273098.1 hypothetical protein BH768_gp144 [Gordonia phage ClubL]YP_009276175.1 hypothetical protein BH772_gp147 [Gordonia phage Bachita]YP_009281218.1 hypothetical protein BIZ74_gp141 [Gordonia phage Cucurbita]ATN90689.1 hypothetical protein SEA_LOZINAK_63 [Gordonia phage Lozinak]AUE23632.1 hypothetical protein SEA_TONIANN_63 [Gordonia phage Toniann]QAU06927.1 hypothetical protein SEA_APHELION_62 [Gordonia phage Aphelion]QKY7